MATFQPEYKLTFGDQIVDTTDEPQASTVVDLVVSLDMGSPADSCIAVLGQVGSFDPEVGDDAKVELGYAGDDDLTLVLTGEVVATEPDMERRRVQVLSPFTRLLRTFEDETFEAKAAGAIVRELADRAGVDVARVADGIEFPAYVVDGRRSGYHHCRDLAALCGFDLYVTPEGELVFEEFAGQRTAHVLQHGEHVIALDARRRRPLAGTVAAFGESPGAGRGDESWAWLTKDFSGRAGTSGSEAPTLLLERPALRTAEAARRTATTTKSRLDEQALEGRVLIQGRPQVKLGDLIGLRGVPRDDLDGNHMVRSVTHRIHTDRGFTTEIGFRSIGEVSL